MSSKGFVFVGVNKNCLNLFVNEDESNINLRYDSQNLMVSNSNYRNRSIGKFKLFNN